ncbi:MAG: biopolymer transporter ExbD [Bdellovibrionales bacterium]|nr:biopolymer transporter ExbD [Bdellovibrionales bacterium]
MAKKKVNIELNMTPFIGLFALLVVMLLLTAVWNHILALSTNTSSTTASDEATPPDPNRVDFHVTILTDKIELKAGKSPSSVPHLSGGIIDKNRMIQILEYWKSLYPDRSDVILSTSDAVTYNQLIETFDTLVGNGWPDVGVSTQ